MRTLRSRLILSHILPLIIILPLLGVVLVYLLETQIVLEHLSEELVQQAAITAEVALDQPEIWVDVTKSRLFVSRFSASTQNEINLLDTTGKLLASNDPDDMDQIGLPLETPHLSAALQGEQIVQVQYTLNLQSEVVEVFIPVIDPNHEITGVVRLSRELSTIYDRFLSLRYLTIGVLIAALLIAVLLGLFLALNLERSLRRVTDAIYSVATGQQWTTLPEHGPQEIRLLLHAFNTLIKRLRTLEETRQRLLANLVHEVGRPIGAVQSAIQALLGGADKEPEFRRELLEGMEAEVNRLPPLLDNLADLHHQILGTLELKRRPTDLAGWLPHTIISWRESAHAKGLHWQTDISDSLPIVKVDPDRLAQILGNLLSNAIKYTPPGGTVSVLAGVEKEEVWIKVSDTGLGIVKTEHSQIFEPFFRSNRDRRFPQGMGLGLTIANDLVTAHGGKLSVDSSPGQGSKFTVWLPLL